MARPRFSEMLVERRRQLGLTVKQASETLRLKEQVLVAFEEGDFANMPKSGYAQGMLSSYARYLGLNPRVVSRQFSEDLAAWERTGGRERAMAETRRELDQASPTLRRRSTYQGTRGLLPTSGGYAGDMGDFATTSLVRPKGQNSPLVSRDAMRGGGPAHDRRYTSRDVYGDVDQSRRSSQYMRTRTRQTRGDRAHRDELPRPSRYEERDRITRREISSTDFTDDLRYGSADPYEAASTATGRRSSRNIASVDRPNVQRRRPSSADRTSRSREQARRSPGLLGALADLFSQGTRGVLLSILFVAILITGIIIMSVNSCVRNTNVDSRTNADTTVSAATTDAGSQKKTTASTTNESDAADGDASGSGQDTTDVAEDYADEEEASEPAKVVVAVADGETSWVEVKSDGKSEVADQVTGPWTKSYTVSDSITVSVNNISAVTVTKDGKNQSFDTKASGIGSMTIQVGSSSTGTASTSSKTSTTGSSSSGSSDSSSAKTTTSNGGRSSSKSDTSSSSSSSSKKTGSTSSSSTTSTSSSKKSSQ